MKHLMLGIFSILTLLGCSKKEESISEVDQMKQTISAKMWKLSSTVFITTTGNVPQTIPACRLDNLWEYKSDGKFSMFPGASKCTPTEVTVLGNWDITDSKGLKITLSSGSYTDEIILLESNKLQLKYTLGAGAYIDTYITN
jgi:hypothetical protein